jgi:hypothetical protein
MMSKRYGESMKQKALDRSGQLAFALMALAAGVGWAAPPDDASAERLELVCSEQPMRAVSFAPDGEVSYGERPAKESGPVSLSVKWLGPGEEINFDVATIESKTAGIAAEHALWIRGKQVEAHQGRLRINLENLVMTLTEDEGDGNARFRRFACEERASAPD